VGGWTFRGVKNPETPAGACPKIDETPPALEGSGHRIYHGRDGLELGVKSLPRLSIFAMDDPHDFPRGLRIEPLRERVLELS
tara:strand:- start:193 stop:438 length:246 start_codon:yes stop_codon:yes gene_type:complete